MISLPSIDGNVKIYESSNSLVFRGRRKQDNTPVVLKVLKEDYPTKAELVRYKQEYEITRSLDLEGVIKVYSQQDYHRTLVIILEDFGGESLQKLMQESVGKYCPMPLPEFLQVAIKITDALGNIHAANVIHKDINPGNIVLNPETGILKIIDFGIATQLSRSHSTLKNPNVLEGTLAYISPEQTGRMNRSLDYRTDFYSLGATFYEMLTHKLPFETTDVMELVHCHIAKQPIPPHEVNSEIPQVVSAIAMKLLAKNAEERYQSAWGIKADLEECLVQLQRSGTITEFSLAHKDISDKFQIPQKLYGREAEVETLLTAFERVAQRGEFPSDHSSVEMMLVSGYSGIGKSVLVQEVYKPMTKHRGYFISGKFDQFQRNIPYSGVVNAFSDLVQQLLTETESCLIQWREKLLAALGINAQVIIDVIPKVELIIGKQPPVPELSPTESQNRFHIVFQHFISVFTKPEHPLVVFLDDLQWADAATLKLIKLLMTTPGSKYLFLIGSYRDNEVSAAHLLRLTIDEIQQSGGIVNNIFLSPLNLPSVNELISDTFKCPPKRTIPLSELVLSKTDGNPFFINEFLKSLYAEKLIEFDREQLCWQWNLDQILFANLTDNVVELMALKIQKLSATSQRSLQIAAAIGHQFDLQILASSRGKSQRETALDLHEAMVEGLVLPLGDAYKEIELDVSSAADELTIEYKFSHDRIQQAAYSLIPEEERQVVHWQVGQLLLQNTPQEMREAKIFDIINQLNFGIELTTIVNPPIQWDELASLNLMAGKKAQATVAFELAFKYLKIGIKLLRKDSWETHYKLTLALYVELTEATYLCGDFEQVEKLVKLVLQQAKTLLDQVKIYEVKLRACMQKRHTQETMKTAFSVLKLLGIYFPNKSSKLNTLLKLLLTNLALTGKRIEDLNNLPQMTDPYKLAAMRILDRATSAVYFAAPSLYPLIVLKQVNLSIKYGNAPESAYAYVGYGVILCGVLEDIDSGYQFGQLALNLLKRLNYQKHKTRILQVMSTSIRHWKEHLRETVKFMHESYQIGLETGDLEHAYYSLNTYCFNSYFSGKELTVLEREMTIHMNLIRQIKQGGSLLTNNLYQQVIWNLMNLAENPCCLVGKFYESGEMLPTFIKENNKFYVYYLYIHQAYLSYLFGHYQEAAKNVVEAEKYLNGVVGSMAVPIFYFYDSLAHLAVYTSAQISEHKRLLKRVANNQKKMKKWAHHAQGQRVSNPIDKRTDLSGNRV
ncbi:hypothetical protein WA1_11740 [Scytonema hofmannii PCC 7110]|uniref:Protein kinase domain-containing protein n=1 Tax=Scytonema hofmannii PCC 7110 TaxID=128403 RepID=A0A139XDM6_9CYAN|nr:serine/threonine-protein kinase PknK [Scytonema hofmannii]KYC42799.1 hypothetical protein WA1_11740 [Scytonema hofmannii PCC 7110]